MTFTKKVLSWDQTEITESRVKDLMEQDSDLTEDKAWQLASEDSDYFSFEWDYVTECFSEILQKVTSRYTNKIKGKYDKAYFYVTGQNLGWRGRSGFKVVEASNGLDLIRGVLPDTECTWFVHLPVDRREPLVVINNYHHDSRFSGTKGEWYHIRPMKAEAVDYWIENGYGWDDELEALL